MKKLVTIWSHGESEKDINTLASAILFAISGNLSQENLEPREYGF